MSSGLRDYYFEGKSIAQWVEDAKRRLLLMQKQDKKIKVEDGNIHHRKKIFANNISRMAIVPSGHSS